MARARNIKPGFFQNDVLGDLSPLARLLFIGMWTIADYKGCLEYRPKKIKAQILPYDDCDVAKLANNLDKSGFISIYSVQHQQYIKIVNFEKHQNPHKNERETGSDIPDIDKKDSEFKDLENIEINRDKNGTDRADSLLLIPDSLIPLTDSLIPESRAKNTQPKKQNDATASRLPSDGEPSLQDIEFCQSTRPDLNPHEIASGFKDYWIAQPGAKGKKLDWSATWRNWVRNARQAQQRSQTQYQTATEKAKTLADRLTGRANNERIIDIN